MSIDAIRWALAVHPEPPRGDALPRANAEALRTLAYLASREADGFTWVSAGRIASDRRIARGTAYRHLAALEREGYIARVSALAMTGTKAEAAYRRGTRRRPVVWRLDFLANVSATETNDPPPDASATETRDVAATETPTVTATETPIGESPENQEESHMSSPAFEDLGGHGAPPPKRFPKQCRKHQETVNDDPCGGCGRARVAAEQTEAEETTRAEAHARAEAERRANERRRCDACDLCGVDGWLDAPGPAVRCTHPTVPAAVAS